MTGYLPPGDLCNCLGIEISHPEVEALACVTSEQQAGCFNYLQMDFIVHLEFIVITRQPSVFPNCNKVAVLLLLSDCAINVTISAFLHTFVFLTITELYFYCSRRF